MAKKIWIKNTESTQIAAVLQEKDREGLILSEKTVVFKREKVDPNTGLTVSNGYTEVEKKDFDNLCASNKMIKAFVDKGTLVVFEDEPDDATTPAQRAATYKVQIGELTARIGELEAALAASEETVDKLTKKLKAKDEKTGEFTEGPKTGTGSTGPDAGNGNQP